MQKGYITLTIALLVGLIAAFYILSPKELPLPSSSSSSVVSCKYIASGPTINKPSYSFNGKQSQPTFGVEIPYKPIRADVPISSELYTKPEHSFKQGEITLGGLRNYDIYFPMGSGEIKIKSKIRSNSRGKSDDLLYFVDWGLIFLVHKNGDDPVKITKDGKTFWKTDVYQDSTRPSIPNDAFECPSQAQLQNPQSSPSLVPVYKSEVTGSNSQLKLINFDFQSGTTTSSVLGYVFSIQCKPAIYLYPKEKTLVNVKVYPKGFLTDTDPKYDSNLGWNVLAEPSGLIYDLPLKEGRTRFKHYEYLYYESKIEDRYVEQPDKGWVVKYDELQSLYLNILPKLGLNSQQTKDFIDYWTKTLPYSTYYLVGIIPQNKVDIMEKLEIIPKPDYINRVRVYFEALDEYKKVAVPVLTNNYEPRTMNFNVVEWGGMVKLHPGEQFTCSQ